MGQHGNRRGAFVAGVDVLDHLLDRDAGVAQLSRQRCEHPGLVSNGKAEVVAGRQVGDRLNLLVAVGPEIPRSKRRAQERVLRDVDDVARNTGGRGTGAGPEARKETRAHHLTLNRNRVEGAVHVRKRIALGHQRGVDPQIESAGLQTFRNGERPNHITKVSSVLNVARVDAFNALGWDVSRKHARTKCEGGQDRQFVPRVSAGDVQRGIRLGEPGLLRRFQRIRKSRSIISHARQNIVAGAVDDAPDGKNSIGSKRLPNHPDHGDGTRDRSLEIQVATIRFRKSKQCLPSLRKQRFVGRHHVLLRVQRRAHQPIGDCDPADELDDDVDVVPGDEFERVVKQGNARILRANDVEPGRVLIRHGRELDGSTHPLADEVRVLQQCRNDAFTDDAATTQPNTNLAVQSTTSEKRPR